MIKNTLSFALAGVGVLAIAVAIVFVLLGNSFTALGSVAVTGEYLATSTAPNGVQGAFAPISERVIKAGQGTLGSVVITGAGTGNFCFYNATTSAITKRASSKATSTLMIACFPASVAAGTYTFDVVFNDGLLLTVNPLDLGTGTMATSTFTYR
jgi:hypothetical protein